MVSLGIMVLSSGSAIAEPGNEGRVHLKAKMASNTSLGKVSYQENGNHRRLNLEVEYLPHTTQALKAVFVNGVWVGNVTFSACPVPAQHLLCGKMELNTQEGHAVPVVTGGQTIQIGLTPTILTGTFSSGLQEKAGEEKDEKRCLQDRST
jgi:hypothetical protein